MGNLDFSPVLAIVLLIAFFLLSIHVARIDARSNPKPSKTTPEKVIEYGIVITLILIMATAIILFYFH
jgi:hypothetical protein